MLKCHMLLYEKYRTLRNTFLTFRVKFFSVFVYNSKCDNSKKSRQSFSESVDSNGFG